ncbi:hypothetical protein RhiirC2_802998 [Rhizophagus irregularis]|uniref:Uncharacterized protein n=1 Tax=Rhizophagus irregularis TaxID=588596 RepID=A0A2N1M0R3_9GLOM|nr:hypothetical protein RhiirC2_802998 [Rhizophagus irregularis]
MTTTSETLVLRKRRLQRDRVECHRQRRFDGGRLTYNGILACFSFGANIDESFQGQGVSNFKIHGQIYHRIGSLMLNEGQKLVFA